MHARIAFICMIAVALVLQPLMAAAPRICGDCPPPTQVTSEGEHTLTKTSNPLSCCACITPANLTTKHQPTDQHNDNKQDNQDNDTIPCGCGKPCCGKSPAPPAVAASSENTLHAHGPSLNKTRHSTDAAPTRSLTGLERPPRASITA